MKYDIDLFLALNEEYKSKPLVASPPAYDPDTLAKRAARRAEVINGRAKVTGMRLLEIGCGHGEVCVALNRAFGCEVVGVDVSRYGNWQDLPQGVTLVQTDLAGDSVPEIGQFDLIYSNSVWEHVRHPFKMLERARDFLVPGGHLLLSTNLYRGPKASHRYREIFFPWPHLLFSDEVIDDYYRNHLKRPPVGENWLTEDSIEPGFRQQEQWGSVWVNQLSIADYFNYFKLVGFEVVFTKYSMTPLDEAFIERFSDKLDRFPRYDLERDFLHAKLRKPGNTEPVVLETPKRKRWPFGR